MPNQTPLLYNPAGKLHTIFLTAKSIDRKNTIREGWTSTFKQLGLKGRIYAYLEHLDEIHCELKSTLNEDKKFGGICITHHQQISEILHFDNFQAPWAHITDKLTPQLLTELRLTSVLFASSGKSSPEPSSSEISSIRKELEAIYAKILESNLDQELKSIVCEILGLAIRSIEEIIIRGTKDMNRTLESIYAKISFNHQAFLKSKESSLIDEFKSAISKYITISTLFVNTTGVASIARQVVKAIAP